MLKTLKNVQKLLKMRNYTQNGPFSGHYKIAQKLQEIRPRRAISTVTAIFMHNIQDLTHITVLHKNCKKFMV